MLKNPTAWPLGCCGRGVLGGRWRERGCAPSRSPLPAVRMPHPTTGRKPAQYFYSQLPFRQSSHFGMESAKGDNFSSSSIFRFPLIRREASAKLQEAIQKGGWQKGGNPCQSTNLQSLGMKLLFLTLASVRLTYISLLIVTETKSLKDQDTELPEQTPFFAQKSRA